MNNVFLAIGPDEFLLSEFINNYKKAAFQKYGEFSVDTLSIKEHSFGEVRNELFSPPFFGGKRIIFLENFPPSATPKLNEKQKESYISLIEELADLPEDVVLISSNANPDKRTSIFKKYKKLAGKFFEHASFDPQKDRLKFSEWIIERAIKHGAIISKKNADFLKNFVGTNLRILDSEIKKLATLSLGNSLSGSLEISEENIKNIAIPSEEGGGDFAFSNAISSGNITKILDEFTELSEKYDAAMIFNRDVLSSFRNLVKGKFALASPAEKSGIHPFVLSKMRKTISMIPEKKLIKAHAALTQIDIMSKTGKLSLSGDTRAFLLAVEKILHDIFEW